jgi:hypothetical protein
MRRVPCLALALGCLAVALAGCGGSGLSPAEARFAATARTLCLDSQNTGDHASTSRELARFRTAKTAARNSPRVAALLADQAARRKVLAELRLEGAAGTFHHRKPSEARPISLMEDASRLGREVNALEKALGFGPCLGPRAT